MNTYQDADDNVTDRRMPRPARVAIAGIAVPPWLRARFDAEQRRRGLLADIFALGGPRCAFVALWLARAYATRTPYGTVMDMLRFCRAGLMRAGV